MLDEWGNHFVEYELEQKCIDFPEINNEELDADITMDEVRAIIRKLKTGKWSGMYGLTAELFKWGVSCNFDSLI